MTRKRFTQIIDKTNNVIPVGGEAQNITLKDGSILEEALGEINFAEKGSIIDQINKLKTDTLAGEYAPLVAPSIQRDFIVQQDYISYSPCIAAEGSETKKGITISRNFSSNQYTISGTFTGNTPTVIPLAQKGDDYNTSNLGRNGTYTYKISTNCLKQGKFAIQFYYNKTDTNNDQGRIYITESMLNGQDNIKTGQGEIDIPSGYKLCRIAFYMYDTAQNQSLNNGSLNLYVYKYHDNTVFRVLKTSASNYQNWQTVIANNLNVKNYKGNSARSHLGTIYNSDWEGVLNVIPVSGEKNGILVKDSGIGFNFTSAQKDITNQLKGITTTPYRIFAKNRDKGIYYDAQDKHVFRIHNDGSNSTNENNFPTVFTIAQNLITFEKPITAKQRVTIDGTTNIKGALNLTGTVKVSGENGSFRSPDVPISKEIKTMKELEAIIHDGNGKYPPNQIIVFRLHPIVVYYLTKNKNVKENDVPSSVKSCIGMGFKTSNNNMHLFYIGEDKIYKTQYYWPEGKYTTNRNRNFKTYSVRLATDELLSNPVDGKGIKF